MRSLLLAALPALLLSACAASSATPHPHDVTLEDGQRYEKNPEVKLAREYWIVVADARETYFMLPRPDGDPRLVAECARGGELGALLSNAKLCASATQETLSRVNALSRDEAMRVSTFLHGKLAFTVSEDGSRVEPYPRTTDLLDVCKTFPDTRAGALKAVCDRELGYENASSRPAIGIVYTRAENEALAPRLNELYGLPR